MRWHLVVSLAALHGFFAKSAAFGSCSMEPWLAVYAILAGTKIVAGTKQSTQLAKYSKARNYKRHTAVNCGAFPPCPTIEAGRRAMDWGYSGLRDSGRRNSKEGSDGLT